MPRADQTHLNYHDTVNYGSYYTPAKAADVLYNMLSGNIPSLNEYKIADTSCGYGSLLRMPGSIGADYDRQALDQARLNRPDCRFFCHNSLSNVCRAQYGLTAEDRLIIIGNPPYNDRTSLVRNGIKEEKYEVDAELRHRDLGISFLLSYEKLEADYICVLHPLSYLIKKANFNSLGCFRDRYRLIDSIIISSGEFSATSKITQFPIIIALYKKDSRGMSYNFICDYLFRTDDGRSFRVNQFDSLGNYITKYPNQKSVTAESSVALFWTMRDINALKRTRTFIEKEASNAIRIPRPKLSLYCYADIFKEYARHLPYYFGNSDIMIDYEGFMPLEEAFLRRSLKKYPFLHNLLPRERGDEAQDNKNIDVYFNKLLGEHYENKRAN